MQIYYYFWKYNFLALKNKIYFLFILKDNDPVCIMDLIWKNN